MISAHQKPSVFAFVLFACLTSQASLGFDYFQPLPENPMVPTHNPLTSEGAALGKQLFFDSRLSKDSSRNCNHCHNLMAGAEDGKATPDGFNGRNLHRSAPTLWNIGLQTVLYWDGRSPDLESMVIDHLSDPAIMGLANLQQLEQRLRALPYYAGELEKQFPREKSISNRLSMAIASFLRSLMTPNSRFDQFIRGDNTKLTDDEQEGMDLFRTVGCLACHFGVNFAGPAPGPAMQMGDGFYELFPNHSGSSYDDSHHLLDDLGVYHVSGDEADKRLWRVPPLRNIALTAPYFHNGSAASLDDAINIMAVTQLRKTLSKEEIRKIRLFLEALTGDIPQISLPALPMTPGKPFQDVRSQ